MDNYGLRYQGFFNSVADVPYRLDILQKGYDGNFLNIVLSNPAVTHKFQTDDPKAPIKGSSLEIRIINKGQIPINSFYSNDDTFFRTDLYLKDGSTWKLLFTGFVVQDDCIEDLIDYTHEITISATDGLGLLKGIPFATPKNFPPPPFVPVPQAIDYVIPFYYESMLMSIDDGFGHNALLITNTNFVPISGMVITVMMPLFSAPGQFTVNSVSPITNGYRINVDTAAGPLIPTDGFIWLSQPINYYGKNSLAAIIMICLANTGLSINTNIFFNLFENTHTLNQSPLYQTYIDCNDFVNSDGTFKNCYDVLTICMLNTASCFQTNGEWQIMRWDELQIADAIQAFVYGYDFLFIKKNTPELQCSISKDYLTTPTPSVTKRVTRPYQYVQRELSYNYSKYKLKNYDLLDLGSLLRSYQIVYNDPAAQAPYNVPPYTTYTYKEYTANSFQNGFYFAGMDPTVPIPAGHVNGDPIYTGFPFFIRIVYNYFNIEVDRYLVVKNYNRSLFLGRFEPLSAVMFLPIEVNANDRFTLSYSVKGSEDVSNSQAFFNVDLVTTLPLFNNPQTNKFLHNVTGGSVTEPQWGLFPNLLSLARVPSLVWNTVSFGQTDPIPNDGLLYIMLTCFGSEYQSTNETYYKGFQFNYEAYINESLSITGHVHNNSQQALIKNQENIQISADDTPKNAIEGTLFTSTKNGIISNRTSLWYQTSVALNVPKNLFKLNQILTTEQLQCFSVPRLKIEGDFKGLKNNVNYSMLTATRFPVTAPNKKFVPGLMTIDYRNDKMTTNFWEIAAIAETKISNSYNFNYIYQS